VFPDRFLIDTAQPFQSILEDFAAAAAAASRLLQWSWRDQARRVWIVLS